MEFTTLNNMDLDSIEDPNTAEIIQDVSELHLASPSQPINTTVVPQTIEIKLEEIPPDVS